MNGLMQRIGHVFADMSLLETALTHPSWEGQGENYQRLEFLGDAVLEVAVSEWLYKQYPDAPEGDLTRARAALVKEGSLAEAARRLMLGPEIRMGTGEARGKGRNKPSILSDVMEAVIGAVYLDAGQEEAFQLVYRALKPALEAGLQADTDYKTRLQEMMQAQGFTAPVYEQTGRSGPAHEPEFEMQVLCGNGMLARGRGRSKQAAQQAAAKVALEILQTTDPKGH